MHRLRQTVRARGRLPETRLTGADLARHLEEGEAVPASAEAPLQTLPFVAKGVLVLDQFLELAD